MTSEKVIISCDNVHKTYLLGSEGVPALRGVHVDVVRGEFLVIYGTSGGGKSSLLNILGTIDTPTKGNVSLFKKRITDRSPDSDLAQLRCKRVGFVFQTFNLLSTMSALDNVSLPMIIAGDLSVAEIQQRASFLLQEVGLGNRLNHLPSMLSGGEQQRVAIARALANDPEVLFLDEPTGDLDTKNTLLILGILLNLNREKGLTMVMVSHDVYMKQYAHRVLYVRDGRIHHEESVEPSTRQRAWDSLQNQITAKEQDTAVVEVKSAKLKEPREYATFTAQKKIVTQQDEELQKSIDALFK